jgi:hypothetical protein
VIYDGRRQGFVEWEGQNQREIELNDASDLSRTGSLAFGVDSRYQAAKNSTGKDHPMATLLRLSLATVTFLIFFYSTTLLTSYFYPLDWAPIAF